MSDEGHRLIWRNGRATWATGAECYYRGDDRRPYPPVLCEACGQPARITVFDQHELTLPEDAVKGYLPGKPHYYCLLCTPRVAE